MVSKLYYCKIVVLLVGVISGSGAIIPQLKYLSLIGILAYNTLSFKKESHIVLYGECAAIFLNVQEFQAK